MLVDPAAAAARIIPELERRGVSCAVGGALCLAYWGVPRATKDLDLNLFVPEDALEPVFVALSAVGAQVSPEIARASIQERGDFVAQLEDMRIDFFVAFHPYHATVASRLERARLPDGTEASFLSAEDLCVFKMLFHRAKDLVDLDRLFAARQDRLDVEYVERWLTVLLGDDARIAEVRGRHAAVMRGGAGD